MRDNVKSSRMKMSLMAQDSVSPFRVSGFLRQSHLNLQEIQEKVLLPDARWGSGQEWRARAGEAVTETDFAV